MKVTSLVASLAAIAAASKLNLSNLPPLPKDYKSPGLPVGPPLVAVDYMVDNMGNTHQAAPDKGTLKKPITNQSERKQFHKQTTEAAAGKAGPDDGPSKNVRPASVLGPRQEGKFWMESIEHGDMPLVKDYQFFRNVKDFGAKGDGKTDDTEAINKAAAHFSKSNDEERCGEKCGQTTTQGAMVYFPPGTYLVSSPIIQYYYTTFIGDAISRPTIKGSSDFAGIALVDTDPYIPGGNGANWYINQNQFFRQIRNMRFDLTAMNRTNYDGGQEYKPTGLHWQVSQAASLQNLHFEMPVSDAAGATTAVGIFMENGSGGFVSDLTFFGGNIGFRAGSQQYTARNLKFTSCLTAISMIWDWGFTWQNIYVNSCYVAIDCTSVGGVGNQGTGSISVLDSHFNGVPYPITLRNGGPHPNIILDNLLVENSASIVLISGGETIFPGSQGQTYFKSWGMGSRCSSKSGKCTIQTGLIDPAPRKPANLLDSDGNIFARSKPTYSDKGLGDFVVVTSKGVKNDGTGDQADAINKILTDAASSGKIVYFPAGIYLVEDTIEIPVGSIIVGEAWPQIVGTGSKFQDESQPKVVVQVGKPGDSGKVEISDMLWSVKGPTAGAIVMEWNVHQDSQGSAAMWDCHFRVGGTEFTELATKNCGKKGLDLETSYENCKAAAMMFHVTPRASGYFENVWVWTADHDMDVSHSYKDGNATDAEQINVYTGRGLLLESEGPTWLYGTGVEHSVLYQYQIQNAKDVFLTHIQTESPYFQSDPSALTPYNAGRFPGDPKFGDCDGYLCEKSWGLRVISSRDILLYTAGLYSFFEDYEQDCLDKENCQSRIFETSYVSGLWVYNLFTKGSSQVVTPRGGIPPLLQADVQSGFTTEINAWLVLALDGGDLGGDGGDEDEGSGVVYVDGSIFLTPSPVVGCFPPCTLVFPPSSVDTQTVISVPPISTSISVGNTVITAVTVQNITTNVIQWWNMPIDGTQTGSTTFALTPKIHPPNVTTVVDGTTTTISVHPVSETVKDPDHTFYDPLPTTVVTQDGTKWTYSMDQLTELVSNPSKTSTTITKTTSENTTLIAAWFNTGGFYWSPVIPTPFPSKLPDPLPTPPPVPKKPCFHLFGIFSILCPPDKDKSTTTYTSHFPTPTCTKACGTVDGKDDKDKDDETSTCATATATECHENCRSTPCATVCNTYVGCRCPTTTVTDYWVSCTGDVDAPKPSCTTTSSKVITGCYETAVTTTTGDYCPLGTVNPNDDQGNDDLAPSRVTLTTRTPVEVDGTRVPVRSGTATVTEGDKTKTVVVSGITPTGNEPITTDINGIDFTVLPPKTQRITVPLDSSPTGTNPPPPDGSDKKYRLIILAGWYTQPHRPFWFTFLGNPDDKWSSCDWHDQIDRSDKDTLPDGTLKLKKYSKIENFKGCTYNGTRDEIGSLSCPKWGASIKCKDQRNVFPEAPNRCDSDKVFPDHVNFHWSVYCEWRGNGIAVPY